MMPYPKISIVTPSFNQGRFLEKTIRSVLDQGYPNLEYIVIDGGSTDESLAIIKKYERHLAYWVSEKDRGQSHAINKGFAKATGDIFGWLNSDDWFETGALYTVAEYAGNYPDAGAFVGLGRYVNTAGRVLKLEEPGELTFDGLCRWLQDGCFLQPSCLFRRTAWQAAGPLDETIHIAFDLDLWLRMVKHARFQRINQLLSTALSHDTAKTTAYRNHLTLDIAIVVIKAGGERLVRPRLEEMISVLTYYESNFWKISNHPLYRLVYPLAKLFLKPALRWHEAFPRWRPQTAAGAQVREAPDAGHVAERPDPS